MYNRVSRGHGVTGWRVFVQSMFGGQYVRGHRLCKLRLVCRGQV